VAGSSIWRPLAAFCLLVTATVAQAAPFTPASDDEVVEKLPLATDAAAKRVEALRRQLTARRDDARLRVEVARRYFELAMAQGDPRLVGYASAAVAPLATTGVDNAAYWLVRGQLEQYSHQFAAALDSLGRAAKLAPSMPDAPAWRAAIFMVQARYPEAAAECERLAAIADPLFATGCSAYVQASTGGLRAAYARLDAAVAGASQVAPELLVWQHTRLAEMAQRMGEAQAAKPALDWLAASRYEDPVLQALAAQLGGGR
jgi:tetratricopeptide (TPR) repeat protein